jgi:flagellar basal-body rod modification protein FlgD
MAIDGIQPYQVSNTAQKASSGNDNISMDDFLALMVAQLSNQDIYNTVDDTQFMSQMAQFSTLQALSELSRMSTMAYSVSMIGKEATVSQINGDGTSQVMQGIVEGVNLSDKNAEVIIEGNAYPISSIIEVRQPNIIFPEQPEKGEEPSV